MDDRELCNNATPYRCPKTTTCSGRLFFGPQDSGIIVQQSPAARLRFVQYDVCGIFRCHMLFAPVAERWQIKPMK